MDVPRNSPEGHVPPQPPAEAPSPPAPASLHIGNLVAKPVVETPLPSHTDRRLVARPPQEEASGSTTAPQPSDFLPPSRRPATTASPARPSPTGESPPEYYNEDDFKAPEVETREAFDGVLKSFEPASQRTNVVAAHTAIQAHLDEAAPVTFEALCERSMSTGPGTDTPQSDASLAVKLRIGNQTTVFTADNPPTAAEVDHINDILKETPIANKPAYQSRLWFNTVFQGVLGPEEQQPDIAAQLLNRPPGPLDVYTLHTLPETTYADGTSITAARIDDKSVRHVTHPYTASAIVRTDGTSWHYYRKPDGTDHIQVVRGSNPRDFEYNRQLLDGMGTADAATEAKMQTMLGLMRRAIASGPAEPAS